MSQNDRILAFLKSGRPLSPLLALDRFGCFRLAARIRNLRDVGYKINTHIVKFGGKKFASYRMPP